jgi:SAM-dependent methyltransferase
MELIAKLKSLGVTPEDLVLDIGSNDGAFMEALRSADFRHLVGVEPSRLLCERGRARGFTVANDYFGPDIVAQLVAKHGCARAVVCRHTLEHVPDPFAFVAALRDCLNPAGGVALLEVPDGAAIPELLNVYEFWDEHLYCFGAENLSQLIERAGMQVLEAQVRPHLDTRNLLMWCLWGASAGAAAHTNTPRDCVALWRALAPAWQAYRHHVADLTGRAPRPMYLIGGSHSQYNFVNYAGIGAFVDHFIDDDPAKAGSFPPVSGGRPSIISTAQFEATARGGTVLKTGFGYPSWTARICEHARRHAMRVLDPREIVAHPK